MSFLPSNLSKAKTEKSAGNNKHIICSIIIPPKSSNIFNTLYYTTNLSQLQDLFVNKNNEVWQMMFFSF
jgi:hypothetical protein